MKAIKKPLSLILALALLLTAFAGLRLASLTASAATVKVWDGTVDISWFTSDKTKDIYEIYTAEQLAGLDYLCENPNTEGHPDRFAGVTINLMNDIVLNDTTNWQDWYKNPPKNVWNPIGKVGDPVFGYCPFAGVFNGNGHTISGMYAKNPKFAYGAGLFNYISGAIICNLKIEKSIAVGSPVGTGPMGQTTNSEKTGLLAGQSENSYIDSVEIIDCMAYGYQYTGGIVGSCESVNATTPLFFVAFLGAGLLVNPLYLLNGSTRLDGTYFNNCKVANTKLYCINHIEGVHMGMAAGDMTGGGIYNTITENCYIEIVNHYFRTSDRAGALLGDKHIIVNNNVAFENIYAYNFQMNMTNAASNFVQYDRNVVTNVSNEEYLSKEFAEKLGKGFTALSGATPAVTALKDATLNQKIVPGDFNNSGKLEIGDVTDALKAFVYNTALDYRTFKAADMDDNGTLNIKDVTAILKKLVGV